MGVKQSGSGKQSDEGPVVIKKYANRRLYNTSTSSYVTLEHLCNMVKQGEDFVVYDAKSGDDITRSVLTQIIVEEESKGGQNLLPIRFLRQLISYYGDGLPQSVLPNYLEIAMENFAENQEKLGAYMGENMGAVFPFGNLEEISRQNMAMFDQAMKMFSPFGSPFTTKGEQNHSSNEPDETTSAPSQATSKQEKVSTPETARQEEKILDAAAEMQKQTESMLTQMQQQLLAMQKKISDMEEK